MKKIFLLLFICSFLKASANQEGKHFPESSLLTDTTIIQNILSLPLGTYIGKPVDSLLNILPAGFSSRTFMPAKYGYTRGMSQNYNISLNENCYVQVFVDTFRFLALPNYNAFSNWNIGLAKKETIAFIKVYKNNTVCLYGCNNPNY